MANIGIWPLYPQQRIARSRAHGALGGPLEDIDLVFVMEKAHRSKLSQTYRAYLKSARVICLNIPDDFEYMQPELITLLKARVTPHLR